MMKKLYIFFHSRFFFKAKKLVLYYLRFWLTGVFVGFVIVCIWKSLPNDDLALIFKRLNSILVAQLEYVIDLWSSWKSRFPLLVVLFFAIILIKERFQIFLKGSLIYMGLLSLFLLNKHYFFINPLFLINWSTPENFLTIGYYLSFWIIVADILLIIIAKIKRGMSIFLGRKRKEIRKIIKIDKSKIKKWINEKFGIKNKALEISDEPLQDFYKIKSIRKTIGEENVFESFEEAFKRLKLHILNENVNKDYTNSICLDGPWGSGKTSLMNIASNEIRNIHNDKIVWIDFSPWNFSDSTELIKDFFETLNKELVIRYKIDLQPNLSLYVDLVTPVIEFTGFFGSLKSLLLKIPFFNSKDLNSLKSDINKKLKDIPDKIIIVLDDLDRLELNEIETVLQLVRQLSNFPNILFILPFDYNRIDSLIVEKKGEQYGGFLGKIINKRIKLDSYSFAELEGIFINSIKHNPTEEQKQVFCDVFSTYVKEKNRSVFEKVRELVDQTKEKEDGDKTLTPMFNFAKPIFNILYPNDLFQDKFDQLKSRIKDLLDFYLSDLSTSGNSLEIEIFEKFSLLLKTNLATEFKGLKSQIDSLFTPIGANPDEINNFNNTWNEFVKSLSNGETYDSIVANFESFSNVEGGDPDKMLVRDIPGMDSIIEQMDLSLAKYKREYENNSEYHSKVKKWLVSNITPRQTKDVARSIQEIGIHNIIKNKDLYIYNAINVAQMQ